MAITAKEVNDLRSKTGLGMMECKTALTEAGGDIQKAVDLLRTKGIIKMEGRTDRASSEGRIGVAVAPDKTKGAIVEINTETDFTAKSDVFKAMVDKVVAEALKGGGGEVAKSAAIQSAIDDVRLTTKENVQFARGRVLGGTPGARVGGYTHFTGKVGVLIEVHAEGGATVSDELLADLCMHVAAGVPAIPLGVNESDVPADVLEKEKQIAKAQALEQGKPEQIAEKMVVGKIRKFYEDHVLTQQLFVKDDKKRIKELLPKGVTIKSFVRYQVGVK